MIKEIITEIKQFLPLKISEITFEESDFLNMYGPHWSFSTLSAWRVSNYKGIIMGCNDEGTEQSVKKLQSLFIIEIGFQSDRSLIIDPTFFLSDGSVIEIFSTDTYEPWVFRIGDYENSDKLKVFVASPSNPNCI